ncbi:MAG: hypothetical protein U1F68_19430 [Gammaproteobacteria bacterium]
MGSEAPLLSLSANRIIIGSWPPLFLYFNHQNNPFLSKFLSVLARLQYFFSLLFSMASGIEIPHHTHHKKEVNRMKHPLPLKFGSNDHADHRLRRGLIQSVLLTAALSLAGGSLPANAGDDDEDDDNPRLGACTKTTNAALRACYFGVRDDFWVAIGKCNNLSNPTAREQCKDEAEDARDEGNAACGPQFVARTQICKALGEAPYDPRIDPAKFVDPAAIGKSVAPNPYFPLIRGRTWIYEGGDEHVTVTVTDETKVIEGVTCAVIHDTVEVNGEVAEDTVDWLAQDRDGNIWYFGENTQEYEDGEISSIDGSFKAGADGAKPGIFMKKAPIIGNIYRQEFSLANAEDIAQVISLTGSATAPAASCSGNCLITKETTPLEPALLENKYYAPGVGFILQVKPATGERLELIEIRD